MSLIQSARLNGHDPYAYLKDVLTRLPTQRDKCHVFRTLAQQGRGVTPAEYPRAGAPRCEVFPGASYPWRG